MARNNRSDSPGFCPAAMPAPADSEPEALPNLPAVRVRGVTAEAFWLLCERYQLSIEPAAPRELKLAEGLVELEEMVADLGRSEERRRKG